MAIDRTKFIMRFAEEAREHISKINEGLLSLEKKPEDMETLNSIFRSAHTIKGASKMLKLSEVSEVAHKLEDALDALRGKKIEASKGIFDTFFKGIDTISELVEKITAGQDIATDTGKICKALEMAAKGEFTPVSEGGDKVDARRHQDAVDPSILASFCEESAEALKTLESDIASLEKKPGDINLINHIFRAAHSIKGGASFLNLTAMTKLMHTMENLMGKVRDGNIEANSAVIDILFHGIDIFRALLKNVSEGRDENLPSNASIGGIDISDIVSKAESLTNASEIHEPQTANHEPRATSRESQTTILEKTAKLKMDTTIRVSTEKLDDVIKLMGEMLSNQSRLKQRLSDIKKIEALIKKNMEAITSSRQKGEGELSDDLIAAMQSLHANIAQLSSNIRDDVNLQELLTAELQEKALKMRMLPISMIFDTFHRAVRDMSKTLGKKVDLLIDGGETEMDKKIIEKIGDPIIHMIRNSIDHGIEKPEDRIKAGKNETGSIKMSASYEGGNVLIRIKDDGAGISLKKIKEKALHKKMFDEETLNNMSESEIIDLIFQPGFSTAAIITDLSGRGVGMDVVKKNIVEGLKGAIRINTKEGKGTTFYISLPLTLSIMRVLMFTVSNMTLAITVNSIHEILRFPSDKIIAVVDKKAISLREQIIPVVELKSLLNLPSADKQPPQSPFVKGELKGVIKEEGEALIIIVHTVNEKLGLLVDSLVNEEDMVIKPLPSHLKNIKWISGVIITGKNEVVNVLHAPMIIASAKEAKGAGRYRRFSEEEKKTLNILVVDDSINTREIEKSILEAYGYKVNLAGDGIEALEKIKELKYDLVITDVEMPRLDGFSLTERLRKDEEYKHTPIIIVTSREKEEDKRRGIQVGADAYIVKGAFDQTNLLETVQNLIG